jgi:hypothetical protein
LTASRGDGEEVVMAKPTKPNILVIWGDDIGIWNLSCYHRGMMGGRTPNIDRIAAEGAIFTACYGQQSCTAGRAAFTNYLGTSIVMMFVFHGWALGLFGQLNRPQLYIVVALASVLMLAWSKPWLDRYRYGPLEWLWRCLTYGKVFPLRK